MSPRCAEADQPAAVFFFLFFLRQPSSTKTRPETKSWSAAAGKGTAAGANGEGIKRAAVQLIGFVTLHEVIRRVRAVPPE